MNPRNLRNVFMSSAALRHVLMVDDEGESGGGSAPADPTPSPEEGEPPADTSGAQGADGGGEGQDGGEEPPPPQPKRVPWQAKRIDALTAQSKAEKERADTLQRQLEEVSSRAAAYEALYGRNDDPPPAATPAAASGAGRALTEADVEARAKELADIRALNDRLENLYERGASELGDSWKTRVSQAGQAFGADLMQRVDFFSALSKLPNAVEVYHSLTGDLDHMSDVLAMSPLDLGMELANMSAKLSAKPKAPAVSRAPAPIDPIDGQSGSLVDDLAKMPMEDYVKARERAREERFKQRGY